MTRAIRRTDENYINPYNFVSIHETVERAERKLGDLRGIIHCELETLQPLIIPGEVTKVDNRHKTYTFFSYDGKTPVIPGSSLRGMLRSYFEAVTNSCLSTADNENVLYRRTGDNKENYGIIEEDGSGGYVMYDAEKLMLNRSKHYHKTSTYGKDVSDSEYKTGDVVWVQKSADGYKNKAIFPRYVESINSTRSETCALEGIVLIGEAFQRKHHDAVFVYTNQNPTARAGTGTSIAPKDFERLRQVWGLYQPKGKVGKPGLPKGVNQSRSISRIKAYGNYLDAKKIPVYYSQVGNIYYLSPACIGKEVFSRTITELLEANGGHQPCNKNEHGKKVCPACALFGTIESEDVIPSRLQIRDAVPEAGQNELVGDEKTLPILSGPKITATEFYMEPVPGSEYFNYDYYKPVNDVKKLLPNPKLRGRKFYWHHLAAQTAQQNRDQNATFKPIDRDKCFKFEIAFERLSELELRQLLWVLSFGRYWDQLNSDNYAHKLGHGKPVGYGSVKINVAGVELFTVDSQTLQLGSKAAKPANLTGWSPSKSESVQELLAMSDYKNVPNNVNYPMGKIPSRNHRNETGIYQWFTLNKGGVGKSKFTDVLPRATDAEGHINSDLALQGYEQYEIDDPVPTPTSVPTPLVNTESVTTTLPTVEATDVPPQNMVDSTQWKARQQRTKEDEKKIKKLAELSKEAGKSGMPQVMKAAKEKLAAYLQSNPRPEDASPALAKAYDEAEAKLKKTK